MFFFFSFQQVIEMAGGFPPNAHTRIWTWVAKKNDQRHTEHLTPWDDNTSYIALLLEINELASSTGKLTTGCFYYLLRYGRDGTDAQYWSCNTYKRLEKLMEE